MRVVALSVLLAASLAFAGGSAVGAQKKLTLLFTGDTGGEVAPCG